MIIRDQRKTASVIVSRNGMEAPLKSEVPEESGTYAYAEKAMIALKNESVREFQDALKGFYWHMRLEELNSGSDDSQ